MAIRMAECAGEHAPVRALPHVRRLRTAPGLRELLVERFVVHDGLRESTSEVRFDERIGKRAISLVARLGAVEVEPRFAVPLIRRRVGPGPLGQRVARRLHLSFRDGPSGAAQAAGAVPGSWRNRRLGARRSVRTRAGHPRQNRRLPETVVDVAAIATGVSRPHAHADHDRSRTWADRTGETTARTWPARAKRGWHLCRRRRRATKSGRGMRRSPRPRPPRLW